MWKLIPDDNPAMALRLNRQLMAVYSYVLVWAATLAAMELGIVSSAMPHVLLFSSLLAFNVLVYLAIRSGLSERCGDPSLTIVQMLAAILLITLMLHHAEELRGAMLAIYFMVMTFGVFALDRRKLLIMSAVVLAAFTALIVYEAMVLPHRLVYGLVFGQWSILALGLIWFVFVGGYIHNLQQRIRDQRESLKDNQVRLEASNAQLHDAMTQLAEIAVRDELTGLYNRRHFIERLEHAIALAERSGQPFYLALIDLDHFKQVNDQHGHLAGDSILERFATLAKESLRRSDVLARFGGEEFIILFPEGGQADIAEVLNRLRTRFTALSLDDLQPGLRVTLSAGLAGWRPGDNADSLTRRADEALYAAKDAGRNRLEIAT